MRCRSRAPGRTAEVEAGVHVHVHVDDHVDVDVHDHGSPDLAADGVESAAP
jgi:hypothetical protein